MRGNQNPGGCVPMGRSSNPARSNNRRRSDACVALPGFYGNASVRPSSLSYESKIVENQHITECRAGSLIALPRQYVREFLDSRTIEPAQLQTTRAAAS